MQEEIKSLPNQTEFPDHQYTEYTSTGLPVPRPGLQAAGETINQSLVDSDRTQRDMISVFGDLTPKSVNNFVGDARRMLQLEALACGGQVIKGDDRLDQTINVVLVYCHKVMVIQPQAGEYVEAVRTVFVDDKMVCWGFTGDGVAAEAARMLLRLGRKPFDPPYAVKAIRQTTRLGRTFITLVPVL